MTSSSASATAWTSWVHSDTDPQPTRTCSTSTPYFAASAAVSATEALSGYRLTSAAASAMRASTEGSGGYGVSLLASLMAPGTVRPGTYAGSVVSIGRSVTW